MIPEAAYAMLACARIGAIHSVVFGGFSPDSLAGRIVDCKSTFVITADEGLRGGKTDPAEGQHRQGDRDRSQAPARKVKTVLVVRRTGGKTGWVDGPRPLVPSTRSRRVKAGLQAGEDEGRGPALHPLHVGLDRQAEGRAAHHRRLSRLCLDDAPICLRLSRRRHLLVHGRCRLGHRPQLHRLRPARQRRDDADVRGRAELSVACRASGRSSTSTRSTSSTPRRPRSAR